MSNPKDISGQKFGRLTALYRLHNYHKRGTHWLCVCECGNIVEVRVTSLTSGHTKSCGCLNKEPHRKTHGKYNTRMYRIWVHMKSRCYNSKDKEVYTNYGGRGITVCSEWRNDFMSFYNWSMANGYEDTLTIDRIDVNGNYEPNNCRWATREQQCQNQRNNKNFIINGVTKCLAEWCRVYNLPYERVRTRIRLGWTIEKALEI